MASKPLRKLKHYPGWNEKISASTKGRVFSAESSEKKRQAKLGTKHSEETKEKIRQARLRWARMTPEEREWQKQQKQREWAHANGTKRVRQWKLDQLAAIRMGNKALFLEIKQSAGFKCRRWTLNVPGISNGQTHGDPHPDTVIDYGVPIRRR